MNMLRAVFICETFTSILKRPVQFSKTANREEMSGGGYNYLALLKIEWYIHNKTFIYAFVTKHGTFFYA